MTTELKVGDLVTVTHRTPYEIRSPLWIDGSMDEFINSLCIIRQVYMDVDGTTYKLSLLEDKHDWWWFHCSVVKKL